jgi:hypothetical protein
MSLHRSCPYLKMPVISGYGISVRSSESISGAFTNDHRKFPVVRFEFPKVYLTRRRRAGCGDCIRRSGRRARIDSAVVPEPMNARFIAAAKQNPTQLQPFLIFQYKRES